QLPHPLPPPFPTRRSSDLATLRSQIGSSCATPRPVRCVSASMTSFWWEPKAPNGYRRTEAKGRTSDDGSRARTESRKDGPHVAQDRKSTRLNSSHVSSSYA